MAIPNVLSFNPIWYFVDKTGKPLGGGYFGTYRSQNPTQVKLVYQDSTNNFQWPYLTIPNVGKLGILIDLNGTQGPFYFAFDPAFPGELYYLEVYDSNGVLQWTIDNFTPPSGSGGSIITTAVDLENIVINNVMYRNIGVTPVATTQVMRLAPGAHSGLAQTAANASPDIYFLKNNLTATDRISFPKFTLGDMSFAPDITPVDYLHYDCTGAGTGEVQKCVQFPITQGVQNLTNTPTTVTIWARCTGGSGTTLSLYWYQFFGDGGGSTVPPALIQTFNLNNIWTKYSNTISATVPSVTGKTLGTCGNDALFLQVQFPLTVTTTIDFTKPAVYASNVAPTVDYHSYDMIDAVINAPRTGYVFSSYDLIAPPGYLMLDDTTIGSAASAATHKGTDFFPLYNWLWTNVSNPSANANCVVSGGLLGANAVVDFTANKTLDLPKALGRAFSGTGTPSGGGTNYTIGTFNGEQTHAMTLVELVAHTHPIPLYQTTAGNSHANNFNSGTFNNTDNTGSTGSGTPFNVIQPTSYLNYFIKL